MQSSLEQRRRGAGRRKMPSTIAPPASTSTISTTMASAIPPPLSMSPRAEVFLLPAAQNTTPTHSLLRPLLPTAPEDMQVCVRTPRAERVTTSCGECRRRKQKCDQGRPCSNCVKRFPQPPCEYKQNKRRNPALSHEPAFKVVLPSQDYDYTKFSGIRSPLLLPAHQHPSAQSLLLPTPMSPPLPPPLPEQSSSLLSGSHLVADSMHFAASGLDHQQRQQQQQQWDIYATAAAAAGNVVLGTDTALDRWPGFDFVAADAYAASSSTSVTMGGGGNSSMATSGLPFGMGQAPTLTASFPSPAADAVSSFTNDGSNAALFLGPDHGTMMQHQDVLNDAFRLLQARRMVPNDLLASCNASNMDDFYAWLRILTWTAPGHYGAGDDSGTRRESISSTGSSNSVTTSVPGTNLFQITGPAADLAHLPLEATRLNADLVRIYVKLISRFKSCLDGNPDPLNPYTRFYVPYCLQTPLLAQVAVYTSACFLHETGHLDKMVAVAHKGRAIHMLNTQLRQKSAAAGASGPPSPTSDDAITAVIQLVMDEWYWGQTENLHAHLRGLREMIRLRGGLKNLGMNGLISKLAVASDLDIALSFEISPVLQNSSGGTAFDFQDSVQAPFRVAHNTPLVAKLPSFAQCAEPLKMHPTTASILDDMRFLIAAVLALPSDPSAKDLQKVQTTAEWIHNRIQRLPTDSPETSDQADNTQDGEMLPMEPGGVSAASRRPSIVLSQAEPSQQVHSPFLLAAQGSNSHFVDAASPYRRQTSASPRLLSGQRGQSGSPLLQPLTPPGSVDGNLSMAAMSRPSSGFNSRRGSAHSLGHDFLQQQQQQRTTVHTAPAAAPAMEFAFSQPPPETASTPTPDPLYQAVRQTALVYARAVLQRQAFSKVVSPHEFVQLWTTTWRVSLAAWKGLLGVFMWVTVAIVASARDTPHDLFVKSMLSICTVQMSLESWDVAIGALKAALRLNAWLGASAPGEDMPRNKRGGQQAGQARPDGGVAGFTTENQGLREAGATLPGWNP